jgi:hypothetical protein
LWSYFSVFDFDLELRNSGIDAAFEDGGAFIDAGDLFEAIAFGAVDVFTKRANALLMRAGVLSQAFSAILGVVLHRATKIEMFVNDFAPLLNDLFEFGAIGFGHGIHIFNGMMCG